MIFLYFGYLSVLYSSLVYYSYHRANKKDFDIKIALDLSLIIMVFGFIGGRAMHVLYEQPEYYANDWVQVFYFWQGGFVFYGGAVLALLTSLIYLFWQKVEIFSWMDFFAPILALGYALGRISCLIAGCCYGRSCEMPWAIDGRHPTQVYAAVLEFIVFLFLVKFEDRKLKSGEVFLTWVVLHSLGRLIMEHYRDDFRGNLIFGSSISTLLSVIFLILGIGLIVKRRVRD